VSRLGLAEASLALLMVKRIALQQHRPLGDHAAAQLKPEKLQVPADASHEFLALVDDDCAAYIRHAGRNTRTARDLVLLMCI
jgi:histone H3/H4